MGFTEVDADNVRDALLVFRDTGLKNEAAYEKAIYEHLHRVFPKENFHRQYANAKTRADIYVEFIKGAKVVVEVKCGLDKRVEYHRLLGQSWEYMFEWKAEVVIALCGKSDPSLVKLTDTAISHFADRLARKAHVVHWPR